MVRCDSANLQRRRFLTYLVSFTFPESMTKTTSGIVIPVSAILVAKTILVIPRGGIVNAFFWSCDESTECRLMTQYLAGKFIFLYRHNNESHTCQIVMIKMTEIIKQSTSPREDCHGHGHIEHARRIAPPLHI